MTMLQGYGSYAFSAMLALVGFYFLFQSGTATYGNPSGDYSAIVARIVGIVAIMLGGSVWRLRLAIRHSEERILAALTQRKDN